MTEETIRIFLEFRERYEKTGLVLQAYLRRSRQRRAPRRRRQGERARLQGHLRRAAADRVPGPRTRSATAMRRPSSSCRRGLLRRNRDPRPAPRRARPGDDRVAQSCRARRTSSRCSSASRAPAAAARRGGTPAARLRAVRRCLVRLLGAAAQGEPLDRGARDPRDPDAEWRLGAGSERGTTDPAAGRGHGPVRNPSPFGDSAGPGRIAPRGSEVPQRVAIDTAESILRSWTDRPRL